MSDYSKATNFTTKDTLPTGNSGKIVKGTELDTEFIAIASAIASKADISSPALLGTPTAPTATAGSNTTQIANCAFVIANSVPTGLISLWSGSIATIPTGWVLCNGSNSTPDLRNKFVIGAHSDTTGVANTTITGASTLSGGTKDAVNVSHTHTATSTDAGHAHATQAYFIPSYPNGFAASGGAGQTGSGTSTGYASITTSISTEGVSATNQNLPPYYALAYIMKS
jgi:hypothetical protein